MERGHLALGQRDWQFAGAVVWLGAQGWASENLNSALALLGPGSLILWLHVQAPGWMLKAGHAAGSMF